MSSRCKESSGEFACFYLANQSQLLIIGCFAILGPSTILYSGRRIRRIIRYLFIVVTEYY